MVSEMSSDKEKTSNAMISESSYILDVGAEESSIPVDMTQNTAQSNNSDVSVESANKNLTKPKRPNVYIGRNPPSRQPKRLRISKWYQYFVS